MQFYYEAFIDLSTERSIGFGEGPIPITAILRYSKHYGLSEGEEYDLIYFVRELDKAYLEEQARKSKTKAGK